MTDSWTLFDIEPGDDPVLVKKFRIYDAENPLIWRMFQKFTFQIMAAGHLNYSANGIFEGMRWHTAITGNDEFKMNNNYRAFYARKFMHAFPEHAGYFRTRKSVADA